MKSFITIIALVLSILFSFVAPARAEDEAVSAHLRFMSHGVEKMDLIHEKSNLRIGVAAWFIWPAVTDAPGLLVGLAGLRFDAFASMHLEILLGANIDFRDQAASGPRGKEFFIADFRLGTGPKDLGAPFSLWTNLAIIGPGSRDGSVYWYLEADWVPPDTWASVGVESENIFLRGNDSTSLGIHVKGTFGVVTLVAAYQRHLARPDRAVSENQFWFRVILNFIE